MYYTIHEGQILTAENAYSLSRYYDWAKPLPEDYETGKYIIKGEEFVLNPNWETEQAQKEAERIANLKLTKREVFLAIYNDIKLSPEDIKAFISDSKALIEFEYANEYYRGNPLIDSIGKALGYSKEDLDYLFEYKSVPDFGNDSVGNEVESDA